MATLDLVIDLGTSNTTIFQKGVGIVLKEPTVAVVAKGKSYSLKFSGLKAKTLNGKLVSNNQMLCPVKEGAIINPEIAALLIEDYMRKILPDSYLYTRINALVPVPCGLTLAERRFVETTFQKARINDVTIIDSPLCAYQSAGRISELVVDIGGGTTEVACVGQGGIINGCSLNIAGDALSLAISEMIERKYLLSIGIFDAEKLKHQIASLYENDMATGEITGRDLTNGYPKSSQITASDIREAIIPLVDKIIEVIKTMINLVPPEVSADLYKKGIAILGGTAQLPGLAEYISSKINMQTTVVTDPSNAVCSGAGRLLDNKKMLADLLSLKSI